MRRTWLWTFLLLGAVSVGCDRSHSSVTAASSQAQAPTAATGPAESADRSASQKRHAPAEPAAAGEPGPAPTIQYVVLVSVDGLAPRFLAEMIAAGELPTFKRLQQQGAWTHNARSDFTHTVTLPNHVTMLTGRPVSRVRDWPSDAHHGFSKNLLPARGETLHNAGNPALKYVPSVFDVAHDHGLKTCLYAGKGKFVIFDQSYDRSHGAPDREGEDNGRDKLDISEISADTSRLIDAFVAEQRRSPCNFTFILLADTDPAGHQYGWGSPSWRQVLRRVDVWLGRVWKILTSEPRLQGQAALIVVADHGGTGNSHRDASDPYNYTVPFYVWAPGVPGGRNLYALVADTRQDPGKTRPDYAAPTPAIRNGEAGNLALELLGLPPIPGSRLHGMRLRN